MFCKRRLATELLERRDLLSADLPPAIPADDATNEPAASVLFIRGADRSGGFLEANNDFGRTEQLADIFNASTAGGNHGWDELRLTLLGAGFAVEQMAESPENASGPSQGIAINFETMDLSAHDAIVFGSNNAVYDTPAIDAIEAYVLGGGSALFISDANFGSDWADASNSDQQFLDRFGLVAHQDQGTYSLFRSQQDYAVPDHPILTGVDRFDGEGVTPIRLGDTVAGIETTLIVGAKNTTRLNEPPLGNRNIGPSRPADPDTDAALVTALAGDGKIAGHYDRNTFFNQNGAGTNINRFDNRQYALNLFGWLVGAFDPIPGDYDDSGLVDEADYDLWRDTFGGSGPTVAADGNGDQVVDLLDYTVWRDNLGRHRPQLNLTASASAEAAVIDPPMTPDAEVSTERASTRASETAARPDRWRRLLLAESDSAAVQEGSADRVDRVDVSPASASYVPASGSAHDEAFASALQRRVLPRH